MTIFLSTLLVQVAAASPCEGAFGSVSLNVKVEEAEAAMVALDAERFLRLTDAIVISLDCIDAPLSPADAARVHRLQGLRLYIARDEGAAVRAFAAARATDPQISLSGLVSDGHMLHALFLREPIASTFTLAPEPREGSLWVDGRAARELGDDRPVVFQVVDARGAAQVTRWVPAGGVLPAYAARPLPPGEGGALRPVHHAGRGMLGAGVGAVVAAGVLYGIAAGSRSAFLEPGGETSIADLERTQRRTNGMTTAAAVIGSVGLGVGSVGVALAW